jgi:hypothetical protein
MSNERAFRSNRTRQQTARILGWAGVLPFAAWTLVAWTGAPDWLVELLIGYGVLILAFMGGTLWTSALDSPQEHEAPLVASIVIVLAALPAFILPAISAALLLAVLFALHWTAEYLWVRRAQPGWYRRMRIGITASVITLLVLSVLIELGG